MAKSTNPKPDSAKFTVYLPLDVAAELEQHAKKRGQRVAGLISWISQDFIQKERKKAEENPAPKINPDLPGF